MLLCVFICLLVPVLSEVPLPQNIHVDKWQLTWTPATDLNATYTVQYHSFKGISGDEQWKVVPDCQHTSSSSCDVALTRAEAEHGCVMLQVQAEIRELTSVPVEACNLHGDSCTPEVKLSSRRSSLTVHLSGDHSLTQIYAGHVKHRIYFGKKGETLKEYTDAASSVTIPELEEGQQFCVKVQYIIFNRSVGLSSCVQCEDIPGSDSRQTLMIVGGVVVVFLLVVPVVAYLLIFHHKKIKEWLQPPCQLPQILGEPISEQHMLMLTYPISAENIDKLFICSPEEPRATSRPPT